MSLTVLLTGAREELSGLSKNVDYNSGIGWRSVVVFWALVLAAFNLTGATLWSGFCLKRKMIRPFRRSKLIVTNSSLLAPSSVSHFLGKSKASEYRPNKNNFLERDIILANLYHNRLDNSANLGSSFIFACRDDDDEGSHFKEAGPTATSTDDQSGIPAKNNW